MGMYGFSLLKYNSSGKNLSVAYVYVPFFRVSVLIPSFGCHSQPRFHLVTFIQTNWARSYRFRPLEDLLIYMDGNTS